jgi:hypothetical protein
MQHLGSLADVPPRPTHLSRLIQCVRTAHQHDWRTGCLRERPDDAAGELVATRPCQLVLTLALPIYTPIWPHHMELHAAGQCHVVRSSWRCSAAAFPGRECALHRDQGNL